MRIVQTTLFAIALTAITLAGCGGKTKNDANAPGGGAMKAEDDGNGGHTYGGAKAPDPCADGAKSDPCSGGE